ncbi:MAG TPA: cupin domain-containing protein [Longimicrobiaceae bacterium]|nr:cupin domain-containing protein [Longimicrobiaceae bacterium]
MPPGTAEVWHRHRRAQELFFVLSGSLTIELETGTVAVEERQALRVPPGVAHQVRNESGDAVEFLVVSEPPSHGDREPVAPEHPPG